MKFKHKISGRKFLSQALFFTAFVLFFGISTYAQENNDAAKKESEEETKTQVTADTSTAASAEKAKTVVASEEQLSEKEKNNLTPVAESDEALFASDMDADKAMEQALQQTVIGEVQQYYPKIRAITTESKDNLFVIVVLYDYPEA